MRLLYNEGFLGVVVDCHSTRLLHGLTDKMFLNNHDMLCIQHAMYKGNPGLRDTASPVPGASTRNH